MRTRITPNTETFHAVSVCYILLHLPTLDIDRFLKTANIIKCVCENCPFKDTLKAFVDFKKKQKSVWSNVFWYVKVCIFWKCIQCTIHWHKTKMLKKISFGQIKRYKKCPLFFFCEVQVYIFLFNKMHGLFGFKTS